MATIQRPVKTYGTRSYVAEVAAAPGNLDPVLSNEVDADLDTIYAAWNGGVDTVNVKPGSITYASLAPDAQLWRDTGTALTPGTNFATRPVAVLIGGSPLILGARTIKFRASTDLGASDWSGWSLNNPDAPDTPAFSSWRMTLSAVNSGTADSFLLQHRAPGAGTGVTTNLLAVDGSGQLTVGNLNWAKNRLTGDSTSNSWVINGGQSNGQPVDDPTKPQWMINANFAADSLYFFRSPIGATTSWATRLQFTGTGDLIIQGSLGQKVSGTTWANPSDPRLKDDVAPYARGLADILSLDPITYRLKADPARECYGFDAAAVRDVMPECVSEIRMTLDPADEEETDGVLCFDMHPILVTMVTAIKELAARVAALEAA